jgi:cytidyltransferase-like protein
MPSFESLAMNQTMATVFVSGCFDVIHGGHVTFLRDARALGDRLVVSIASDDSLWQHKRHRAGMSIEHRVAVLQALDAVDEVVVSPAGELGLDFVGHFKAIRPQILAVTEDDQYGEQKQRLCAEVGARYVVLPKRVELPPVSTSEIRRTVATPAAVPLRVDFAGGWLDVPRFARPGEYIVNCAIQPLVSLADWPYRARSGLGGSAAYAMLHGSDGIQAELGRGVGWQDPAIIRETGLCAWRSGSLPSLALKSDGRWLQGRLAVKWSGQHHDTPAVAERPRPYPMIAEAGRAAYEALRDELFDRLCDAVELSYRAQLDEGMAALEFDGPWVWKYCGGGWGGYVVCLFADVVARDAFVAREPEALAIEPYCRFT